jgi:putative addiction module component (TIGR02574 family)
MEDLWQSLAERPEALDVPEWHREELDARLKSHRYDPAAAPGWSEEGRIHRLAIEMTLRIRPEACNDLRGAMAWYEAASAVWARLS